MAKLKTSAAGGTDMAQHYSQPQRRACTPQHAQRGVSLIEFLVGSAIGLIILTASATLLAAHIQRSNQLLQQARLRHDLRSSVHLVSQHLRRAAYRSALPPSGQTAWSNPYGELQVSGQQAIFYSSRDAVENHRVDHNEVFGVRLHAGRLEMALGAQNWQALTDPEVLKIVAFSIEPHTEHEVPEVSCEASCRTTPEATIGCNPTQQSRSLRLRVLGQSAHGSPEQHEINTAVHLRNDRVQNCPTHH
jgi:prepilin-type N-terminal cleavage/methylation domain-containing protein